MANERRLEFGFGVFPFVRFRSIEEAVEVVRLGEDLRYDTCSIPEHLLTPTWPTAGMHTKFWHDQATLMAFFAGHTRRLHFLTSVMVLPYHPPIQMAKALATADNVSNGRIRLGIGVGWMTAEFKRLGIPFNERGAITDEYLQVMQELWANDSPSFEGRYVAFRDVSFFPKPVRRSIPIYVGGTGAGPFRRAARFGDGWIPMTASIEELRAGRAEIERQMRELGRNPADLAVSFGLSMGEDPETAAMRHHVDGAPVPGTPPRRTPAEAIELLRAYQDAGVTHVTVAVPWRNAEELKSGLREFAREVMPAFR